MKSILVGKGYPLRPEHIDTSAGLVGPFHIVDQHIACNIVVLCQEAGAWKPFTATELKKRSSESGEVVSRFLSFFIDLDYLSSDDGEKFKVMHKFAANCFLTSPAF